MNRLIVFALVGLLIAPGCSKREPSAAKTPPVPVETVPVKTKAISIPVHTSGVLSAAENIKLSFKIGGLIDEISAEESQSVRKGQPLASLALTEIKEKVRQAREGLAKAERDLQRAKRLYHEGAASKEQFQNATTAFNLATSQLQVAEFNLAHAVIRAPDNGKILKRFVEEQEMIAAGYPVFLFAPENKSWIVRCGVAESQIIRLGIGDSATVTFSAWPGKSFTATVSELAESIDPSTGTFEVELLLSRPREKLVPGFVAHAEILPSKKDTAVVVPIEALIEAEGKLAYLYTPQNGKAKRVSVEIGPIAGGQVVVTKGLDGISRVITAGGPYLRDGAEITISEPEK